jgi:thioredoxin-like negative regulator of GroEL
MMKQSDFVFSLTLNEGNRAQVLAELAEGRPVVACLCAAWCDTCSSYRAVFETLAQRHPDQRFLWIDIEDQSDIVGELDIDNFPTILIQRDALVAFFGPVLPDPGILQRLLQAQMAPSAAELAALAQANAERRAWQNDCNLRTLLGAAG